MGITDINDAMDVIDIYGPDRDFWPTHVRDDLDDLIKTDDEFASYVAEARRIDDLLSNWKEDADGSKINTDDLDWGDDEQDDDGEEDSDFDQDYEDEDFDGGMSMPAPKGAVGSPITSGDHENEDEDKLTPEPEEEQILEIDVSALNPKDMDDALAEVIRRETETDSKGKYVVFTRDYDRMVDINVNSSESIEPIDTHVAKTVGPLMKDLRRMIAARSQVRKQPGMRSGRLHSPNLHRILAGDDRVFTRRQEAPSLDTAISLVIDCSGSMWGGRLALAAQTAYALGTVLNKLGISFECLGFTTVKSVPETRTAQYRKEVEEAARLGPVHRACPIVMPKYKTFDERWNPQIQRRFAYVHNNRGNKPGPDIELEMTPEGCGNEFAARRLLQRKESRKIMITMTDGEPGIMNHTYDPNADQSHAANMVESIKAAGIDIIGIGIQHAGVKKHYPDAMVINSIDEMPAQLLGLLKKLLIGK